MTEHHLIIVPGGLNTDIIGLGVKKIIGQGELTLGGRLKIGPGGKARNMAQMAASYLGKGKVAMIGKTSQDPYGLWKIPLNSLRKAGVDTTYVKVLSFEESGQKFPGVALIPVNKKGENQIYVLPGANADFTPRDIKEAQDLFLNKTKNKVMLLALEIPIETVFYSIEKAYDSGIKVVLDPGGIQNPSEDLLSEKIFLIKPNEHEARIMTGIKVNDFDSASKAADMFISKGIQNVLITHGDKGAYFFNKQQSFHIPCPKLLDTGVPDETGCGDQVSALAASGLADGKDISEVVELSVLAGTMQFYREGIQPVKKKELLDMKRRIQ
ncbi:MAG: ribokinase [Candidatus Aminicenantes bacterium]